VAAFRVKTGRDYSVVNLHGLSIYPSPICVLFSKENSIINKDPS
jgi:hypothetical protein